MNLIYRFSSPKENYGSINHVIPHEDSREAIARANEVMEVKEVMEVMGSDSFFNDFDFYKSLLDVHNCISVDISKIKVWHTNYCKGFQVIYRSTFRNGSIQTNVGPRNFYNTGYYSYHAGTQNTCGELILEEREYIMGLKVIQGEVLDGVTFVTNLREVHFGGHGGNSHDIILNPGMKIIALTGTVFGVVNRVGFYAKPRVWMIIGHYVMLRWLIGQNRAQRSKHKSPLLRSFIRRAIAKRSELKSPSQENVIRDGIDIVMHQDLPDPLFQIVMSFLY
jgi:hypothetical protein